MKEVMNFYARRANAVYEELKAVEHEASRTKSWMRFTELNARKAELIHRMNDLRVNLVKAAKANGVRIKFKRPGLGYARGIINHV